MGDVGPVWNSVSQAIHAGADEGAAEASRHDPISLCTVNTIEGFWSLMKRGIVGTYHKVSRKYLPLYIAEFQFRYNNRSNLNIFEDAISGC